MDKLNTLIRYARKAQGRSQAATASAVYCSPGYLQAIEAGDRTPSTTFCDRFAEAMAAPEVAIERWEMELNRLRADMDYAVERHGVWVWKVQS